MKRLLAVLLAALLCLTGCTGTPAGPADPVATPTAPVAPDPAGALSALDTAFTGRLYGLCAAGEGKAVLCYSVPEDAGGPEGPVYAYRLALIDAGRDALLAQVPLTERGDALLGVRSNGEILVADIFNGILSVFLEDLTLARQVPLPEDCFGLTFDPKDDCLYYSSGSVLWRVTQEGEVSAAASFGEGDTLCAWDAGSGLAVLERGDEAQKHEYILWDLTAGAPLEQVTAALGRCFLHDGSMVIRSERTAADGEGVFSRRTVLTLQGEKAPAAWKIPDLQLAWDEEAPYAFGVEQQEGAELRCLLIDPAAGRAATLSPEAPDVYTCQHCYFPESGGYLIAAGCLEEGQDRIRLFAVNADGLTFDTDLPAAEPECEETILQQRRQNMAVLRQIADGIEEDFGVTVVLGDDCLTVDQPSGYTLLSTDAGYRDVSWGIAGVLADLRTALSCYPVGSLARFRDSEGEGGLRFVAVADMVSQNYEAFTAGGLFYRTGVWFNMALDVGSGSISLPSVQHEMWHAVEEKILDTDKNIFYYPNWQRFNPTGFYYSYDFDKYRERSEQWKAYIFSLGEDPHFVREYSTVTDKEDRAALIEALYDGTFGEDPAGSTAALADYPRLKAKLDYMAGAVRQVFGAVYWETKNL